MHETFTQALLALLVASQFTIIWRLGVVHADLRSINQRVTNLEGKIE